VSQVKEGKTVTPDTGAKTMRLPPRHPKWNVWQVLFLILLIYAIEFPLGWLESPNDLGRLMGRLRFIGVGLGEGLLYVVVVAVFMRAMKRPFSEAGYVPVRKRFLLLGFICGIFLFVAVGLLGGVLADWLGHPEPQSFTIAVNEVDALWEFALLLFLGTVVAPLKEELIFRGLLYPPLRYSYGRLRGILLTSVLFASLHLDLIRFIPLLIGGIVLTWLYERAGSLWPSVVAHGTWNMLMALALWLQR